MTFEQLNQNNNGNELVGKAEALHPMETVLRSLWDELKEINLEQSPWRDRIARQGFAKQLELCIKVLKSVDHTPYQKSEVLSELRTNVTGITEDEEKNNSPLMDYFRKVRDSIPIN